MKVKAPTERNFRRAQVKPGRGKRTRRWPWLRALRLILSVGVVLYAGYRASGLVLHSTLLRVSRVTVQGNVRLSSSEVEQLAHGLQGTNILAADLTAYRQALLGSPWVGEATLRRVLPSTIEIVISERRPFGLCRLGGTLYLIDRSGTVIDEFGPQYAEFDLPIIDGLVLAPADASPAIDPARAALAARVIDSVSASAALARRVSQIDVSDVRDAVVLLDDDTALLHLGTERFRERLQSYIEVAAALRERVPEIDYVDLRFEERVYVRPRGGAAGTPVRRERARAAS